MNYNKLLSSLALLLPLAFAACTTEQPADYTLYVNPFIGTGGHGHTFPGALVPNGMIQPSPDTRIDEWDACAGYHYSDSTINGFSHTHLSGTGCCDYGDLLIMPTVGVQDVTYTGQSQQLAYSSPFSHDNESASAGYYSVLLDRYNVKAELTATERVALHRYTFPESSEAGFVLDFDYSLQRQRVRNLQLEVISDTEIVGSRSTWGWAGDQRISFYAQFSKPFTYTMVTDSIVDYRGRGIPQGKILLHFATAQEEEVLVKVAISAVDIEGAKRNAEAELAHWDFDQVQGEAKAKWNALLSSVAVETPDQEQMHIFYTAMYHSYIAPHIFSDVDGRYFGMDHTIRQLPADEAAPNYTVYSTWDTFRALHPMLTIINPELNNHYITSLLRKYEEAGLLPMWELASNYTATMIGYHSVPIIVDAYMKGQGNFDPQLAFEAICKSGRYDTTGIVTTPYMLRHVVPMSKHYKNTLGYVPFDYENESVAKGLEYAYNDWCIAQYAEKFGHADVAKEFDALGKNYHHYFDSTTGFMRGKSSQGEWRTPFSPRASHHRDDDYCEGTAWQWTWFVPHDVEGLVSLMGGRQAFIDKLDSLFLADSTIEGEQVSVDISGLIGQYAHGNEPSHHILHLYNYVNQPWKTQQMADSVLYKFYKNTPDEGVSGNEDCGQMSAWYILNAMGFYQVAPGEAVYSIGRPLFDKVTIALAEGKEFVIKTTNNSRTNCYIQQASLNGEPLTTPFLHHDDIMQGGILEFEMGGQPSEWGVQ